MIEPFVPHPLLPGPWRQTLAGAFLPSGSFHARSTEYRVPLDDGDVLSVWLDEPHTSAGSIIPGSKSVDAQSQRWRGRTLVLVHGLGGSSESTYMLRLSREALVRGARVIRVNQRGCGTGESLARHPYNAGRSQDVMRVLEQALHKIVPGDRLILAGISLGANVCLKLASELEDRLPELTHVAAISPPLDLAESSNKISSRRNLLFDQYFVRSVKQQVLAREAFEFPRVITLKGFDELYTAPRSGFENAAHYYRESSAGPRLYQIRKPTLIIVAEDDPVISFESAKAVVNPAIRLVRSERGGHVGFLGPGLTRWADRVLLNWVDGAID